MEPDCFAVFGLNHSTRARPVDLDDESVWYGCFRLTGSIPFTYWNTARLPGRSMERGRFATTASHRL